MPFKMSWEANGAYCRLFGECTVTDLLQVLDLLGVHPRFTGFHYAIIDFLAVSGHRITQEDLELVAAMDYALRLSNRRIHMACVAMPAVESLWRHYAGLLASPDRSACFPRLLQARRWVADADRYSSRQ
jgi:hypothetical protein